MTGATSRQRLALLTAGERLGWTFRDRQQFRRAFPEPEPVLADVPDQVRARAATAGTTTTVLIALLASSLLILLPCCAFMIFVNEQEPTTDGEMSPAQLRAWLIIMAIVAVGLCATAVFVLLVWRRRATTGIDRVRRQQQRAFAQIHAEWLARRAAFIEAERRRVDTLIEWGAAPVGASRIDVFGGNLWGWEALLTVFGTSMLTTRGGLTVVDLSGEGVAGELAALAQEGGMTVDAQVLPAQLAESDLLDGLGPDELATALVESMHGGQQAAGRGARTMDRRILDLILDALGEARSMARIAAALRVAMNEPGPTPELTAEERLRIADELFSDTYRSQVHENLRRIEAHVHPLRTLGSSRRPRPPARLTCLAVTERSGTRGELLQDLVVQWLTHRISTTPDAARTLVIAGADDLRRAHVERIADVCDRRSVRLVLMFRHLREASLELIGGGTAVFLKLGNHEEAARAADHIGRQHRFVLSSLTHNLGGSHTHGTGTSDTESSGHSGPATLLSTFTPFGRVSGWNTSRSWGTSRSYSESVNWTDAESSQRVYEYVVEPRTLQDLPDYAMLVVESTPTGPVIRPVECNPDIVSLPLVSMHPLPQIAPQTGQPVPAQWQAPQTQPQTRTHQP